MDKDSASSSQRIAAIGLATPLGQLVDGCSEFAALFSPSGSVIYRNEALRALLPLGHPGEECALHLDRIHPPWACELLREEGVPAALAAGSWSGETAVLRRDGSEISVGHRLLRVDGGEGGPLLASVMHDLSVRRALELERIEVTNRFDQAIRASSCVHFEWYPATGEIVYGSNAQQLFGFSDVELKAGIDHLKGLIHPEDLSAVERNLQRAAAGREALTFEFRLRNAHGEWIALRASGAFYLDRTGSLNRFTGLLVDVTELRTLKVSLASAERTLEHAAREQLDLNRHSADVTRRYNSDFLTRISHELRTPLNAILGFTQLLELERPTPRQTESIQHIAKAGQHLLALVNDVLDLARLESGRLSLFLEPIALEQAIAALTELIRPAAARNRLTIHAPKFPKGPMGVTADRQRFRQVLLNLLANAIKYNRPNGSITLSCDLRDGNCVRIQIADGGVGISPDRLQQLLAPFEDRHGSPGEGSGIGAGIALSKALVDAMGGRLGIESVVGVGTTAWLELPFAEPPIDSVAVPPGAVVSKTPRENTPTTLLYVEDEDLNLHLVERLLADYPEYRLITAMQGGEALDLARAHRPELILLDLNLPDMPGEAVLRGLKEDPALQQIPVVMVTADVMSDRLEKLIKAGAAAYVTKPFRISEFVEVIQTVLGKGSAPACA